MSQDRKMRNNLDREFRFPVEFLVDNMHGKINPLCDIVFAVPVMDDYDSLMVLMGDVMVAASHQKARIGMMVCVNSPKKTKENEQTVEKLRELCDPSRVPLPISLSWLNFQNGECVNKQGTARAAMFNLLGTILDANAILVAIDADCRITPDFIASCMEQECDLFNFDLGYHGEYVEEYGYYDRWFRYNREFWKLAGSPAWWVRQKLPGICFKASVVGKVPADVWDIPNAEHLRFLDFCLMAGLSLKTLDVAGAITADTRTEVRIAGGMSDDVIKATRNQFIPVPHPRAAISIRRIIESGLVRIDSYIQQSTLFGNSIPKEEYVTLDEAEKALPEYKSKFAVPTRK